MPQGDFPDFTALHPGYGVVLLDTAGGHACVPQGGTGGVTPQSSVTRKGYVSGVTHR